MKRHPHTIRQHHAFPQDTPAVSVPSQEAAEETPSVATSQDDSCPETEEVISEAPECALQGEHGMLFMVAVPIGCAEDFSPRARRVLESADLVLAEDTRRTLKLCGELGIHVKSIISFHDHNEQEKEPQVLARLRKGDTVALVSDAGTPVMADPGYRLVRSARKEGIPVHPVPGPSAPVTALSAAGIPPIPYTFVGFLPRDDAGRSKLFETFKTVPTTLAFFERKDRLPATLAAAAAILGPRQCAVCRELTKIHEEFILFTLKEAALAPIANLLGEITVLIGPPEEDFHTPEEEVRAILAEEEKAGGKPREIARRVQARVSGWNTGEIYALAQGRR